MTESCRCTFSPSHRVAKIDQQLPVRSARRARGELERELVETHRADFQRDGAGAVDGVNVGVGEVAVEGRHGLVADGRESRDPEA